MLTSPWWFCNGWWSPWCVIDTIAHMVFRLPLDVHDSDRSPWICRKHDESVKRHANINWAE